MPTTRTQIVVKNTCFKKMAEWTKEFLLLFLNNSNRNASVNIKKKIKIKIITFSISMDWIYEWMDLDMVKKRRFTARRFTADTTSKTKSPC